MKVNRLKNVLYAGAVLAGICFKANVSYAIIQEGHFSREGIHAFVKVTDGTAYGLLWEDAGNSSTISLFRIDELDDGTEEWMKLMVSQNQMIATDSAQEPNYNYTGTIIDRGTKYLNLNPTEYSQNHQLTTRLILKESDDYAWLDLPAKPLVYKTEGLTSIERRSNTLSNKKVTGGLKVNDKSYNGNYVIRTPIPQVGTLHSNEPTQENETGLRVSRQIFAFVIRIQSHAFLDSKELVAFFKLSTPGQIEFNEVIK